MLVPGKVSLPYLSLYSRRIQTVLGWRMTSWPGLSKSVSVLVLKVGKPGPFASPYPSDLFVFFPVGPPQLPSGLCMVLLICVLLCHDWGGSAQLGLEDRKKLPKHPLSLLIQVRLSSRGQMWRGHGIELPAQKRQWEQSLPDARKRWRLRERGSAAKGAAESAPFPVLKNLW